VCSSDLSDAAWDLHAAQEALIAAAGGRALVLTGVRVAIPIGFAGLVLPRSGLARRDGVTIINAPGLVDPGYTGELTIAMVNHDPTRDYLVRRGDRIAQLLISPTVEVRWVATKTLPETDRGGSGLGSTGYGT